MGNVSVAVWTWLSVALLFRIMLRTPVMTKTGIRNVKLKTMLSKIQKADGRSISSITFPIGLDKMMIAAQVQVNKGWKSKDNIFCSFTIL